MTTSRIVQITHGGDDYVKCVAVRYEVLRRPLGMNYSPEQLAVESDAFHFAAFDGSTMVGTVFLERVDEQRFQVRQMAILAESQQSGIGTQLLLAAEKFAVSLGVKSMLAVARDSAVGFYEKMGYVPYGEQLFVVGLPHRMTAKDL